MTHDAELAYLRYRREIVSAAPMPAAQRAAILAAIAARAESARKEIECTSQTQNAH